MSFSKQNDCSTTSCMCVTESTSNRGVVKKKSELSASSTSFRYFDTLSCPQMMRFSSRASLSITCTTSPSIIFVFRWKLSSDAIDTILFRARSSHNRPSPMKDWTYLTLAGAIFYHKQSLVTIWICVEGLPIEPKIHLTCAMRGKNRRFILITS